MLILKTIWGNFERIFSIFLISIVVFTLGLQVFFRYILGASLAWSEELSRFAFVWFIYISASLAAQKGSHIRVTASLSLFPDYLRKHIIILADIIWVMFNVVVLYQGVKLVNHMTKFRFVSGVFQVSLAYIYIIIPLSFFLMTIRIIESHYKQIKYQMNESSIQGAHERL